MRMNPQSNPPQRSVWPRVVVRRTDQAVIAAGVVAALFTMAAWWAWQEWLGGGWIDIERAEPLAVDFKIDVNTADWPELALMPNVGEKLAKRIVEHRAEHGRFESLDDLDRVRGIGRKTLDSMRPYLLPISGPDRLESPQSH